MHATRAPPFAPQAAGGGFGLAAEQDQDLPRAPSGKLSSVGRGPQPRQDSPFGLDQEVHGTGTGAGAGGKGGRPLPGLGLGIRTQDDPDPIAGRGMPAVRHGLQAEVQAVQDDTRPLLGPPRGQQGGWADDVQRGQSQGVRGNLKGPGSGGGGQGYGIDGQGFGGSGGQGFGAGGQGFGGGGGQGFVGAGGQGFGGGGGQGFGVDAELQGGNDAPRKQQQQQQFYRHADQDLEIPAAQYYQTAGRLAPSEHDRQADVMTRRTYRPMVSEPVRGRPCLCSCP